VEDRHQHAGLCSGTASRVCRAHCCPVLLTTGPPQANREHVPSPSISSTNPVQGLDIRVDQKPPLLLLGIGTVAALAVLFTGLTHHHVETALLTIAVLVLLTVSPALWVLFSAVTLLPDRLRYRSFFRHVEIPYGEVALVDASGRWGTLVVRSTSDTTGLRLAWWNGVSMHDQERMINALRSACPHAEMRV
jgi:hypothetical protein